MSDERYYTRQTLANGNVAWFRFADEALVVKPASRGARVLPLRPRGRAPFAVRQTLLVGARRGGRTILVGSSRRPVASLTGPRSSR